MRILVARTEEVAEEMAALYNLLNRKHQLSFDQWKTILVSEKEFDSLWLYDLREFKTPELSHTEFHLASSVVLFEGLKAGAHFVYRNKYGQSNYIATWGSTTRDGY